jgi:hypothetical protein
VKSDELQAIALRNRRGSRFKPGDAVFQLEGVVVSKNKRAPSSMSAVEAFAILAPPIPFRALPADVLKSSAAKLYFVITHCRRNLDARINHDFSNEENKWYLTEKEFEKVLLSSGVDWMERTEFFEAYKKIDLNKSGSMHVAELSAVLQSADEVCRELLNETIDRGSLLRSITRIQCPLSLQLGALK